MKMFIKKENEGMIVGVIFLNRREKKGGGFVVDFVRVEFLCFRIIYLCVFI